ncbi:MAG TPA: metallophosphoesterase [Rhizomicrobium sp.]|jgi:3',5'-cyclic AMP phosphodiesterase CpdA
MSDAISILHLSDLHLCKDKLIDQHRLIGPLIEDIRRQSATPLAPQLIAITGDLVESGDAEDSYYLFLDQVVMPLLDATGLSQDRLIIVPGNHDARRSTIESHLPFGVLNSNISDRDKLNEFYQAQKSADYFAEKFKNFTMLRSLVGNTNVTSENTVYSNYYIKDLDVAVTALNSAWLSAAGINGNEKGALAVPELALFDAQEQSPKAAYRLLLSHHPLHWMNDENSADLASVMAPNTFHLFGHVHDPLPESRRSLTGQMFACQSGALFTARRRYSGYSIVSIPSEPELAQLTYRSFFEKRKRYDAGTDITSDGNHYFCENGNRYWQNRPKRVSSAAVCGWIRGAVAKDLSEKLNDEFTRKPIKEIFVEPTLNREDLVEDNSEYKPLSTKKLLRWSDFARSNSNHLIRGQREFGKSTILKELAYELCSPGEDMGRARVPIIVRFRDLDTTGNSFARLLRGNVAECPVDGFSLQQLSDDGYLCVLIDDVEFSDVARVKKITEFMRNNPKNRYVLTSLVEYSDFLGSTKTAEFPVPVESLRLDQFSRTGIRRVVENLHPAPKLEQEQLLNRILSDLRSINVPCTAVNGAILLTVFQSEKSFVPVNRAIVLERFIDITLDRYALKEAQRSTFDSTNKTHLLAATAKWMCENDKYTVDFSELYDFTQKWLSDRALKYAADSVLGELLSARLLSRWGNDLGFTYRSFLEFFVAKAMQLDTSFKTWVTHQDRYLSYTFELEYYSGLDRNDSELLKLLADRFVGLETSAMAQMGAEPDLNLLEDLKPPPNKDGFDVATITEQQLKLPSLTEAERDEILEAELPVDASHRQEVYRPAFDNDATRWFSALILYSRVFRNMEFVSADEKAANLKILLRSWAKFMMIFIQMIPNLAKHKIFFINGIKYEVLAPKDMSETVLSRHLLMSAPRAVAAQLFEHLSSEKLAGTLEDEARFTGEPAIITLLRRSLYSDMRLPEFIRVIGKTFEDLKRFGYLAEAFLWKVNYNYRRMFLEEHEDQTFRRMLARVLAVRTGERGKQLNDAEAKALQDLEKSRLIIRRQGDN